MRIYPSLFAAAVVATLAAGGAFAEPDGIRTQAGPTVVTEDAAARGIEKKDIRRVPSVVEGGTIPHTAGSLAGGASAGPDSLTIKPKTPSGKVIIKEIQKKR